MSGSILRWAFITMHEITYAPVLLQKAIIVRLMSLCIGVLPLSCASSPELLMADFWGDVSLPNINKNTFKAAANFTLTPSLIGFHK